MPPTRLALRTIVDRDPCGFMVGTRVWWMLACLAAVEGCRSATLTYPYCPVPVLLSRVDRIGATGLSPEGQRMVAVREMAGSTGSVGMAAGGPDNSSSSEHSSDPGVLTAAVLAELPPGSQTDRDELRLDRVDLSAFVSFHLFFAMSSAIARTHGVLMRAP